MRNPSTSDWRGYNATGLLGKVESSVEGFVEGKRENRDGYAEGEED
jgi:hypothetical protein